MYVPDLIGLRRVLFPALQETRLGKEYRKFSFPAFDHEHAGVLEGSFPDETAKTLKSMTKVYPCNLAAMKYRTHQGKRNYEKGSYAYRPEGFFGKWQYHFRLFRHPAGTSVFAHKELNPWHDPSKHYHGHDWNASQGKQKARELLDLNTELDPL